MKWFFTGLMVFKGQNKTRESCTRSLNLGVGMVALKHETHLILALSIRFSFLGYKVAGKTENLSI